MYPANVISLDIPYYTLYANADRMLSFSFNESTSTEVVLRYTQIIPLSR